MPPKKGAAKGKGGGGGGKKKKGEEEEGDEKGGNKKNPPPPKINMNHEKDGKGKKGKKGGGKADGGDDVKGKKDNEKAGKGKKGKKGGDVAIANDEKGKKNGNDVTEGKKNGKGKKGKKDAADQNAAKSDEKETKSAEGNGKGEKKKGKKGKKGTDPAATGDDVGKEENENHKEDGKKSEAGSKNGDENEGGEPGTDREGWATGPKPDPIKPTIECPGPGPEDKRGIERILQLATVYDDPDYGGCTISGLLSSEVVLLMVKKTHLLEAVLTHKCTLIARHEGRIIGICLCTDKGDQEWENAWANLKATFPKIADRDEILKQVYKGDETQAGKTVQIHQLAVDSRYRRMTVATQLIEECVKRADGENYHRISIICTDAFSEKIVKKLKFEAQGDPLHYKKFVHPTTGSVIYKCIYKKPHKKMVHYTMRF
ncbi:uncharacterized protein LOC142339716 isoform X3 [Convolutriloba macropyga]|uniref:uncharacterized protein LOC142339716 isoform X3 n=1 Tax=Convolutriloba macropyga TaxID=536237 RepID=UPI003F5201ED